MYDKLAAGSDLTNEGRPDLLARDRSGVLWLCKSTGDGTKPFAPRVRIGGGWNTCTTHLIAPGNLGGATAGDLLALDKAGVLWLYFGKGNGTFAPRTRVGGGWTYQQIVNIGDIDRDGRADLLAEYGPADGYVRLSVYKGTGDWKAPFHFFMGSEWLRHGQSRSPCLPCS
ncbi:VCBS repeat-containing protein [Streptomyces sp. NBC_00250]|uniref:FG-GAP repeat domain-containing protein n=1 Tax=Streptomyces sp. NBC_00250 TaxID=2903641 RepID=UPI002E2A050E|nr:VCBS repeat-containing protein [Streptomyces sp. NBC_00250]